MNGFSSIEKSVFEEFYRDKFYRIDFVCGAGDDEDEIEREREASEWCCSDEICTSANCDAVERLEREGYIYCDDDDYYRLTAKGLNACREICG